MSKVWKFQSQLNWNMVGEVVTRQIRNGPFPRPGVNPFQMPFSLYLISLRIQKVNKSRRGRQYQCVRSPPRVGKSRHQKIIKALIRGALRQIVHSEISGIFFERGRQAETPFSLVLVVYRSLLPLNVATSGEVHISTEHREYSLLFK